MLTYVSPQCKEVFGYTPEEMMVNWTVLTTDNPINNKGLEFTERAIRTGRKQDPYLLEIKRKDGGLRIIEVDESPVKDDAGTVVAISGALRDVTQRKKAEDELLQSEQRYRAIAEDTPVLVCRFGPDGIITYANEAYCQYFGRTPEQLIGSSFLSLIPQAERETVMAHIRALTVESPTISHEHQVIAADGQVRWHRWTNRALFDSHGKRIGYQAIGEDITDRKNREDAVREMALFPRLNPAPVLRCDADGMILLSNEAAVQILGDAARRGAQLKDILPALAELDLKKCVAEGLVLAEEVPVGDRSYQFVIRGVSELGLGQIYGSDITARRRAEDELCGQQLNLKAMASKILRTQEHERRLLAVELHDNICQGLVLIKLALESSLHMISDTNVLAAVKIACGAIGETIEEADSLTFALSNPVLNQLGFVAALEKHLTEEIQQKYGIECDLESDEKLGEMPDEVRNCLFRVTRELLTNAVKHAHARNIRVRVRRTDAKIRVSVQDNGVGFEDIRGASVTRETARFGLFSVREQLEYLGGTMKVKSKRGSGTTVAVVVPMEEKVDV
jgi:PAS domain S-box-containing protein